jgi:hypothetical protein
MSGSLTDRKRGKDKFTNGKTQASLSIG